MKFPHIVHVVVESEQLTIGTIISTRIVIQGNLLSLVTKNKQVKL